jgi:fatty acid desaturase
MLNKYGDAIASLEKTSSWKIGFPLLLLANASLLGLSLLSGSLPIWGVILAAVFPGSMFSLWQLQILHDVVHGSFLNKQTTRTFGIPHRKLQKRLLFWGSLPCFFGYYLYLKRGHLSHHNTVGSPDVSLAQLFQSSAEDFEDGDMLFVAHRMQLKGDIGPTIRNPFTRKHMKMSISRSGFYFWKQDKAIRNALVFATSFIYERILLGVNDCFVAVLGRNLFFPNKPNAFQKDCVHYARAATILRGALLYLAGWKSLLFLLLSETLWSIPPHPACAMFVTNHGSTISPNNVSTGRNNSSSSCIPTSSTYAGAWYSLLTLGTNFHCEHHDFTSIPFHQLHKLKRMAPEFYPAAAALSSSSDSNNNNLFNIMKAAFSHPQFYACMDANINIDVSSMD